MPLNRYVVRVDPQGQSVTVDILDTSGASVVVYDSPQFAAAPRTLPMVITAQTDFWLHNPGPYDVSCKVGGAEVADAGAPKRVQVSDVPVLVVPDWERERTAASSGGSSAGLPVPKPGLQAWDSGFDFGLDASNKTLDHTQTTVAIPFDTFYENDGVTSGGAAADTGYATWAGAGALELTLKQAGWYLVSFEIRLSAAAPVTLGFGIDFSAGWSFYDGSIPVGNKLVQGNYLSYYDSLPGSGGQLAMHFAGSGLSSDVTVNYASLGFIPLFAY